MLPSLTGHLLPWKASRWRLLQITSWALAAPSCARKKSPSPTAQHTQTLRSPSEPTSPAHLGRGGVGRNSPSQIFVN